MNMPLPTSLPAPARDRSPGQAGKLALGLLLAPALLWLGLLIVLPHVNLLQLSFHDSAGGTQPVWSTAQYATFFDEPLYWHTFVRTAAMSLLATALALGLAFPVAWTIAKVARGRSRAWLFAAILIPFWASELVRTLGWIILLRQGGILPTLLHSLGLAGPDLELLYSDATILVGLVYGSLLFMLVPLINVLDTLDDSLIEAACDLGAGRLSILWRIVVPHAAPGIAAGCLMVFMLTLGNYLTPVVLGGKDSMWFTDQIYTQFITRFNWEQGSAFAFLLLTLSSLLVWLGLRLTGQRLSSAMRQT